MWNSKNGCDHKRHKGTRGTRKKKKREKEKEKTSLSWRALDQVKSGKRRRGGQSIPCTASFNTPLDKHPVQHTQTQTLAKHDPSSYRATDTVDATAPPCTPPRANTAFRPAVDTATATAQAPGTHTATQVVAPAPATHTEEAAHSMHPRHYTPHRSTVVNDPRSNQAERARSRLDPPDSSSVSWSHSDQTPTAQATHAPQPPSSPHNGDGDGADVSFGDRQRRCPYGYAQR